MPSQHSDKVHIIQSRFGAQSIKTENLKIHKFLTPKLDTIFKLIKNEILFR